MPNRFSDILRGGAGAAATGIGTAALASNPVGWAVGLGLGAASLYDTLSGKSDAQIAQERKDEQRIQLIQMRTDAFNRLTQDTNQNIGRVNQFTTGSLQRSQADLGRRSAGSGRAIDEADILASQGQITGQGSNAIQTVMNNSDSEKRRLEDFYAQQEAGINADVANSPIQPNTTDVLESIAPAALQYGMNQQYINNMRTLMPIKNTLPTPNVSVDTNIPIPNSSTQVPQFTGDTVYTPEQSQPLNYTINNGRINNLLPQRQINRTPMFRLPISYLGQ